MTPEEVRARIQRDMPEVIPLLKSLRAAGFDVRWSRIRVSDPGPSHGTAADELLRNSRELNPKENHGLTSKRV